MLERLGVRKVQPGKRLDGTKLLRAIGQMVFNLLLVGIPYLLFVGHAGLYYDFGIRLNATMPTHAERLLHLGMLAPPAHFAGDRAFEARAWPKPSAVAAAAAALLDA